MPRSADLQMRSQLVAPVLALVREAAGDGAVAALIGRFALPPTAASEPETVLPLTALHGLLDAAERAAGDPFLGLHVAERIPRGAYGVLEFSCRSAPTIRGALVRIVRYMALLNELVEVTLDERDDVAVIEQRIAREPRCVGRHANEFFAAMLLLRARQLSGAPCVPARAWFAHPQPTDVAPLLALLGTTEVRFDAGANGLVLPAAVLDEPLLTSDPPLLSLLDRHAEQSLAGRQPGGGGSRLLGEVRQRIRETLGDAPPSLETVAAALRLSRRTLQRRLADEGVSFQALVDEVRRALAVEYVRDPRRPLGEVAFMLGYAELSPFLRAFKRWTGRTPGEVRAGLAPAVG